MTNYENDNHLPEEELTEQAENEAVEEETELSYDADGEVSETDENEEYDDGEDISAVAESLAMFRNPHASPDAKKTENEAESGANPDEDDAQNIGVGHLFYGFTLKKTVVTVLAALLTLGVMLSSMVTAVAFSGDKTKRPSDCDMTADEEAEEKAREEAAKRAPLVYEDENAQFKVRLDFFDREDIELYTTKMTLGELLDKSGIELEEGEEPTISLDTILGGDATVAFDKYETVTDVVTETVDYETEARQTDLIWIGTTNYVQYGKEGKAEITYSVKLKNGEEVSREEVGRYTVEWPVKEIYEVGVGGSFTGADGNSYTYSMRKIVKATYYYIPNDPYTYLGNHPDHSTIAVDMNVIPLGTWLYVKNNRYDFGLRQAQDIGGAIKGDMIDIWLDGTEAGYANFHQEGIVYDMEVYYVN